MESVIAGVRCGANAVYLGGKLFNARRNAGNFDDDELREAVRYCHGRNVKVYLTVNTLIGDAELELALAFIGSALKLGIDALIIQDLGLAMAVREVYPCACLHASTQMAVTSPAGFQELEKLGFRRAVLPREMSREEIAAVRASTTIELEAFVHGALCMCVSGQCYLSAVLGGRSGNRGLCAQPCRLPFSARGKNACDLSLKDLSLVDKLQSLSDIGVCSFKIEGRMKRSEYVAAATTACREALEGTLSHETREALQSVFSRSGFTQGYYTGKLGPSMFGTRRKEDVVKAAPVLNKVSQLYKNETPLVPVSFTAEIRNGVPVTLEAGAMGMAVSVSSGCLPEAAVNKPMTEESVRVRLAKCGSTQFYAQTSQIHMDEGLIVSAGALNALRREALALLDERLSGRKPPFVQAKQFCDLLPKQSPRYSLRGLRGRFTSFDQLPASVDKLLALSLPLGESTAHFEQAMKCSPEIAVELPRIFFDTDTEAAVQKKLEALYRAGVRTARCASLAAAALARKYGFALQGDFGLNVFNSASCIQLQQLGFTSTTVSFELTARQAGAFKSPIATEVIGYGRLPLMITRNCPVKNSMTCKECRGKSCLTDRKNIKFPVRCDSGVTELLNSLPLYLADKTDDFRTVDIMTLYFTDEDADTCDRVIDQYIKKAAPRGEFTRGLYYRGVE